MQLHPSGYRIANRYEIAGRPLLGGMGIVYLCFDHQEQHPIALKTFQPNFLPDRAARERFLEEGNTWVRLGKHPHIVRAYGVERIGDGREVYLVLELVAKEEGRRDASLRSWLTTSGKPVPVDHALLIALQIVRGMRYATVTIPGFVHRDLKPENVLVGADRLSNAPINRVRVTDFGLVKGLRAEQAPAAAGVDLTTAAGRLTRVGALLGTPAYMAPEQWNGADVTIQADIYALGCIMGEMVLGRLLLRGGTLDALRQAHQGGQALAQALAAAPPALRNLLSGCLAVEPGHRYWDWAAVETALATTYDEVAGRTALEAEKAGTLSWMERVMSGWSYSAMGASYLDMGNAQAALGYFQRAYQIGQVEGERWLEAAALNHLGLAYAELNAAHRAIGFHEQSLAVHRETGNRHGESSALGNLGAAYGRLGDAHRAIRFFEQALAIDQELSDRNGEGADLGNLGNAYLQVDDPLRAINYYKQALAIFQEIGDRSGEGNALGNLGSGYLQLDEAQQSIGFFEQALAIHREIGDGDGESKALSGLGNAYIDLNDAHWAIRFFERALVISQEIGDRDGESKALSGLGNAYIDLDDAHRAIRFFERALVISREIGDNNTVALASFYLALLHAQQGDLARALPLAREAERLVTQMGQTAKAQQARQFIAQLEGDDSPGTGPSSVEILVQFAPVIEDAVAAARGDGFARSQLEGVFDLLIQKGWRIADPIRRIWAGQRDEGTLTAGLNASDGFIVREILRRL